LKQIAQLKRKIANHEQRQQTADVEKLKKKIETRQKEITQLRSLDVDFISKQALTHDLAHFQSASQQV